MDNVLPILQQYHLIGMFLLLLACGFGFPMPEDVILVTAGFLAHREGAPWWESSMVAYLGVILGDSVMYFIGYRLGHRVFASPKFQRILTPKRKERIEQVFQKWGPIAIFAGRFAAGIRAGIFLTAGSTRRVRYRTFFIYDSVAALLSVPLFIWLGYQFAENIPLIFQTIKQVKIYLGVILLLLLLGYLVRRFWLRKKIS